MQVFYATDRATVDTQYGPGRGRLVYGVADVEVRSVQPTHWEHSREAASRGERVVDDIIDSSLTFHFLRAQEVPETVFYRMLRDAHTDRASWRRGDTTAVLFIHGFNNGFNDVAERTAALAYRTNAQVALMFSWPSRHKVFSYVTDLDQARWAAPDLRTFLDTLTTKLAPRHLNVIVHSMGSQALAYALTTSASMEWPNDKRVRTLTFVNPDYDAQLFERDALPAFKQFAKQLTLYGTRRDVPLRLAVFLRSGYARAGQVRAGTFECPADVDCIDITPALPRGSPLHHFDVLAANSPLASDFAGAVVRANPASCRAAEGTYVRRGSTWVMRKRRYYNPTDVPAECQRYGTRDAISVSLPAPRRASVAATMAAMQEEFGAASLQDSNVVIGPVVLVDGMFLSARVDVQLRDLGWKGRVSGLMSSKRSEVEEGGGIVVDDMQHSAAQWARLEALGKRLIATQR